MFLIHFPFPTVGGHLEHSLGDFLECDGGVGGGDGVLGAVLGAGVGSPRGDDSSLLEPFVRLTQLQHEQLIIIHFILVPQIDYSVKLYNHGEGPYEGLLLVESAY